MNRSMLDQVRVFSAALHSTRAMLFFGPDDDLTVVVPEWSEYENFTSYAVVNFPVGQLLLEGLRSSGSLARVLQDAITVTVYPDGKLLIAIPDEADDLLSRTLEAYSFLSALTNAEIVI